MCGLSRVLFLGGISWLNENEQEHANSLTSYTITWHFELSCQLAWNFTNKVCIAHFSDVLVFWRRFESFKSIPMFVEGSPNVVILDDGWTAVSDDQSRAAQFEHTVLITEAGCEILTWSRQTSVLFKPSCLCRWIQSVKRFLCLYVFTFVRRSVGNHEDLMWLKINMTKELC